MNNSERSKTFDASFLPPPEVVDLELARRSLKDFVRLFWPSVETELFISNWHLDVICEHLEAISTRDIRRLLINLPPRHGKTLCADVFWPAWEWVNRPETSFLFASYASSLSIRDSVKCRRVIQSPLYQALLQWAEARWTLCGDQNAKQRYDNTAGGYRLATSVDGALTGEGAAIIGVDDPHNIQQGESEAERNSVIR